MNERIRQLAEQARAWVNDPDNVAPVSAYIFYKDMYDKKFAELIVAEACQALSPMLRDQISRGHAVDLIKKHFGVE